MGGKGKKSGKGGGGGGKEKVGRNCLPENRKSISKKAGVPNLSSFHAGFARILNRAVSSSDSPHNPVSKKGSLMTLSNIPTPFPLSSSRDDPMKDLLNIDDESSSNEETVLHHRMTEAVLSDEMATFAMNVLHKTRSYEMASQICSSVGTNSGDSQSLGYETKAPRNGLPDRQECSMRRFHREFQKVVEASNVILEVVDARDPLGCRLRRLEEAIVSEYGDKKKVLILLNKVDLLPGAFVAEAWVNYFEQEGFICLPFCAAKSGKNSQNQHHYVSTLFRTLRQLARSSGGSSERCALVVGLIGYPNVGKSSVINSLRRKPVVGVANTPGFTTGLTEVELRQDIRIMDCPGIVLPGEDTGDVILRNAVKISTVEDPVLVVSRLLTRCRTDEVVVLDQSQPAPSRDHPLRSFYQTEPFKEDDVNDFLRAVGLRRGRVRRGGEVDEVETARMILSDWNDGRIPYYTLPFISSTPLPIFSAFHSSSSNNLEEMNSDPVFKSQLAETFSVVEGGLPRFHIVAVSYREGLGGKKRTEAFSEAEDFQEIDRMDGENVNQVGHGASGMGTKKRNEEDETRYRKRVRIM